MAEWFFRNKSKGEVERDPGWDEYFTSNRSTDNSSMRGKAASYVRALDKPGPILTKHYPNPIIGGSMWHGFSLADIHALHEWICAEMKKGAASPVLADFESPRSVRK